MSHEHSDPGSTLVPSVGRRVLATTHFFQRTFFQELRACRQPGMFRGPEVLPEKDAAKSSSWRDARTNARDERATRSPYRTFLNHPMSDPIDQPQRTRFISELEKNFSVVASAGSGKTAPGKTE